MDDALLEELAAAPASSAVDSQSVSERSASDLIALDNHLTAKANVAGTNNQGGAKSAWNGLRPARFAPPGAQ
jgi:hypothetical protein